MTTLELRKELMTIQGVGPYAATNLLMILYRSTRGPCGSFLMSGTKASLSLPGQGKGASKNGVSTKVPLSGFGIGNIMEAECTNITNSPWRAARFSLDA